MEKYNDLIKQSKKKKHKDMDIKKKIELILGKKRVRNRNDYIKIYGAGDNPSSHISRSNHPRRKNMDLELVGLSGY